MMKHRTNYNVGVLCATILQTNRTLNKKEQKYEIILFLKLNYVNDTLHLFSEN